MLLPEVVLDVARENVTCGADAVLLHQAAKGDHGDLSGASAYVHHHVPLRGEDVQTDAECGRHRLVHQIDVPSSGMLG